MACSGVTQVPQPETMNPNIHLPRCATELAILTLATIAAPGLTMSALDGYNFDPVKQRSYIRAVSRPGTTMVSLPGAQR